MKLPLVSILSLPALIVASGNAATNTVAADNNEEHHRHLQASLSCLISGSDFTTCCPTATPDDGICTLLHCADLETFELKPECDCNQVSTACVQVYPYAIFVSGLAETCTAVNGCCSAGGGVNSAFNTCMTSEIENGLVVPDYGLLFPNGVPDMGGGEAVVAAEEEVETVIEDDLEEDTFLLSSLLEESMSLSMDSNVADDDPDLDLMSMSMSMDFTVVGGGSLRKTSMLSLDGTSATDRVVTLPLVFGRSDKKAEDIIQTRMTKILMMNLMKDGGKGLEYISCMEGMEEMLQVMGGAEGTELQRLDRGGLTPEDVKKCIGMMEYLLDSGQVSEEELTEVQKLFEELYGTDVSDLIKADEEGERVMTEDERELLDMFEQIFGVE